MVMSGVSMKSHVWRARWAAVGAAVAVTLGAGGMLVVNAEPADQQTGELEFVAITPTRFFDSRIDAREGGTRPFNDGETQQLASPNSCTERAPSRRRRQTLSAP